MSAMTATTLPDKIILLTDAAIYDTRNGVLLELRRKSFAVPGLACAAYAVRGNYRAFERFEAAFAGHEFVNWADFVAKMDPIWTDYEAGMAAIGSSAEIMVAGWDEVAGRGRALFRFNHPDDDLKPHVTYFAKDGHFSCGPLSRNMGDPASFDPCVDGVRAFEAARRAVNDLTCGEEPEPIWGHSVGGWVDETVVDAVGVRTRRIHTWDSDVVGEKIMGPVSPYILAYEACLKAEAALAELD